MSDWELPDDDSGWSSTDSESPVPGGWYYDPSQWCPDCGCGLANSTRRIRYLLSPPFPRVFCRCGADEHLNTVFPDVD